MATRASKRKATQVSDIPTDGGAAADSGAAADGGAAADVKEESKLTCDGHGKRFGLRLAEELDRERRSYLSVVNKQLEEMRSENALNKQRVDGLEGVIKNRVEGLEGVIKQIEEARSELALSKKRVEDLEGRNVVCMDAEALLQLRHDLEVSLKRVKKAEDRLACLPYVPEILPSAACPLTKQCMIFPVVASDGNTYERSAIEKHIEAAGEEATSPLTGEKLESHNLETNWSMRTAIVEAVEKVLARKAGEAGGE